ncbi:hypothetical protein HanRHA438_Chr04g0156301 [Helianthus annuus]|nr:hypothetical protein HanRHA438_Chr04g0156301 [Helianthus annuus]
MKGLRQRGSGRWLLEKSREQGGDVWMVVKPSGDGHSDSSNINGRSGGGGIGSKLVFVEQRVKRQIVINCVCV